MTAEEAPEFVYGLSEVAPGDPLVRAINRLAQAIEQATLAKLDATPATPGLAPLPPVRLAESTALGTVCPTHNQPWKTVPAGVSKKTGNAYEAFQACPVRGCDQRPR
jgi:hypothetical protein